MKFPNLSAIRDFFNSLDSPRWQAIKEVMRWVVFYLISWLITATLEQIGLVPESVNMNVWVFTYTIPLRAGLQLALTFAGRYIDKLVYATTKENPRIETKGVLPF